MSAATSFAFSPSPSLSVLATLGASPALLAEARDAAVLHGPVDRIHELLGTERLRTARGLLSSWPGTGQCESFGPTGAGVPVTGGVAGALAAYESGRMVVLYELEKWISELVPVCRSLERELGLPVGAIRTSTFCGIRGGGAPPHFDDVTTLNCQLEGEKEWVLAANSIPFPPTGMVLGGRLPTLLKPFMRTPGVPKAMPANAERVVARPGSVVFLPPGYLHATEPSGPSFSLAFWVSQRALGDLVVSQIERSLRRHEDLRRPMVAPTAQRRSAGVNAARELRRLADILERRGVRTNPFDDVALRLKPGLCVKRQDATTVILHLGNHERVVSIGLEAAAVLEWAAARTITTMFSVRIAAEALTSLPPNEIRRAIRSLVAGGLIERRRRRGGRRPVVSRANGDSFCARLSRASAAPSSRSSQRC